MCIRSGAIDIVVVKYPDGRLRSSPFHVRFGKFHTIMPKDKVVNIYVNDKAVRLKMKLGRTGEAFFVNEVAPTPCRVRVSARWSPRALFAPSGASTSTADRQTLASGAVCEDEAAWRPRNAQADTDAIPNDLLTSPLLTPRRKSLDESAQLAESGQANAAVRMEVGSASPRLCCHLRRLRATSAPSRRPACLRSAERTQEGAAAMFGPFWGPKEIRLDAEMAQAEGAQLCRATACPARGQPWRYSPRPRLVAAVWRVFRRTAKCRRRLPSSKKRLSASTSRRMVRLSSAQPASRPRPGSYSWRAVYCRAESTREIQRAVHDAVRTLYVSVSVPFCALPPPPPPPVSASVSAEQGHALRQLASPEPQQCPTSPEPQQRGWSWGWGNLPKKSEDDIADLDLPKSLDLEDASSSPQRKALSPGSAGGTPTRAGGTPSGLTSPGAPGLSRTRPGRRLSRTQGPLAMHACTSLHRAVLSLVP